MDITIHLSGSTVKQLTHLLPLAYRAGDLRSIQRITALLWLDDGHPIAILTERLGMCKQTIYNWLAAFVLKRWARLRPRTSPGRPAKLSVAQKQRLGDLIDAGPEAAGYATGCWNTALQEREEEVSQ